MKELLGVNANVLSLKGGDKLFEIIIMVQEPKYELNNESDLIRTRIVDEYRFFLQERHFDEFIETIKRIKDHPALNDEQAKSDE